MALTSVRGLGTKEKTVKERKKETEGIHSERIRVVVVTRRLRLIIDFVAVGQVFVIAYLIFWDWNPVDGAIVIVIEEPGWDRRGHNCGRDTKDEAGIQVIALLMNIGVVLHENGRIEPKLGLNGSARFGLSDTVNIGTILSGRAKAELFTDLEIAAGGINNLTVDCGELERGHILCSGDSVTDITGCDGVATSAIGSGREHR
jgi:hypothetical protein